LKRIYAKKAAREACWIGFDTISADIAVAISQAD
jgi:hypothetical protein